MTRTIVLAVLAFAGICQAQFFGVGARTEYVQFIPAVCQGASASLSFSLPAANKPEAVCITGTNSNYGVAAYDDTTAESVQTHVWLPTGQTGAIDVTIRWRAAATTGAVVWAIQTACVGPGQTGDPAWNTPSTVTDAAAGATLSWKDTNIAGATTTGCGPDKDMLVKLYRDAAAAADDMSGDAQLINLRFIIRRRY